MEHFENTRKYFLTLSEHNYGVAKASRSSHDAREAKMKAEIYQDFADVLETNIDKSRKALEALRDEMIASSEYKHRIFVNGVNHTVGILSDFLEAKETEVAP